MQRRLVGVEDQGVEDEPKPKRNLPHGRQGGDEREGDFAERGGGEAWSVRRCMMIERLGRLGG